jgi:hypothetical protein
MDGIFMPTVLPFSVPAIPKAMLVKALYYINNQETHVRIFQEERADQYSYYVLKKDNEYGAKTITPKLIELFEAARGGEKDTRIKDHATLLAVCDALHVVGPPADGQSVLPCEGNPCGFDCKACKAFKQVGICSHVLTINHMLTRFNVRFQLKAIQTNALLKKARGSWGTIERHRCQPFNASPKWSPTRATKRRSAFSSLDSRANRTSPRYVSLMYLLCISSVSCVYPARLGRSVQDTCIVMYPDCILKCRHDAFKIHVS